MLKKIALAAGVVLGGGLLAGDVARAGDEIHGHHGYSRYGQHGRLHDNLDHNDFHRQLYHREVHRYPMSPRQHGRVHDDLDHDRFHDQLGHRQFHRSYRSYSPGYRSYGYPGYRNYGSSYPYGGRGVGIGVSPYGFSLRIGR